MADRDRRAARGDAERKSTRSLRSRPCIAHKSRVVDRPQPGGPVMKIGFCGRSTQDITASLCISS
eukprot:scaffold272518_cov30-Tisochrysis_lutea.AAC.2